MKKGKLLKKIIMIGISAFILLIAILFIFRNSLSKTIANAVADQAEAITQTEIDIKDFTIYFLRAKATIDQLNVGNPKGYHNKTALGFNQLAVDLDIGSLMEDTVIIEEITVDGLQVTFETDLISNNLNDLKKNIDNYVEQHKQEQETKPEESVEEPKEGKEKKFIIKKLNITNGKVTVSAKHIEGSNVPVPIADIHLTDIGTAENGADASEIAEKLIDAIIVSTKDAVADGEIMSGEIKTKGIMKSIKGLFK